MVRLRLQRPLPRLRGRDREGAPLAQCSRLPPPRPPPQAGEGARDKSKERERKRSACGPYAVVRSNTPPEAFSLRASRANSERISLRSLSPVLASGTDTILRPLR